MATALVTQIAYAVQTLFDPAGTAGRLVDLGKLANYGLLTSFTPGYLFTTGVNGAWYDPSDMTTLFQDAAGTQPVTAVEQPVGLMLDKSKGLVLGPELVVNGDFSTDTWWSKGTDWSISGGAASRIASTGNSNLYRSSLLAIGKTYKIELDIIAVSGTAYVFCGGGAFVSFTSAGRKSMILTCAGDTALYIQASGASTTLTIDNISVRELPGNHAFNSSGNSANFPVLSARYNLLTKTEQFDDTSVWLKRAGTGTITRTSGFADPQNGTTAWKLDISAADTEIATGVSGGVGVLPSGLLHCIWLKGTAGETIATSCSSGASSLVTFTGGWQQVNAVSSSTYFWIGTWNGSTARTIYVWHPDARASNDALNQPAYQRVNTSTDYDTVGFKPYLRFNGTNQWLQTNSIDFTYGDKMFVSAGVRELSGATVAIVAESSVQFYTNSGTFVLAAPGSSAPYGYEFDSRGTQNSITNAGYTAPITNVLSGIGNISGDQAVLRVNGAQAAISTSDQGTGNYGNYPLYIGARAGSSLWFNGRLYQMVVAGKQASAAEIANTETYLNQKTGAY